MEHGAIMHIRIAQEIKDLLDDLRDLEPDQPTKSEMMRRLILRAAEKAPTRRKAKQP